MTKDEILTQLRSRIPEMKCIPGCTSCCGHTAWSEFEWNKIPKEKREKFDPFSFKCSFCDDGCSIHEDRPIICRMFGVSEGMKCPKGVKPEKVLSLAEVGFISSRYMKEFFKGTSQRRY